MKHNGSFCQAAEYLAFGVSRLTSRGRLQAHASTKVNDAAGKRANRTAHYCSSLAESYAAPHTYASIRQKLYY